jgi:K+/H+ antiporter YhaU regulatory subunit KhtT
LIRFSDFSLDKHPKWIGQSVSTLKKQTANIVVAIKRGGDFVYAPQDDEIIQKGDDLIVIGPPDTAG